MATVLAIPSSMWIQLPGTEWEVYQESGGVAFLGDEDVVVCIRRAEKRPSIWGPRPPYVSVSTGTGDDTVLVLSESDTKVKNNPAKVCRGLHCKCMNLDGLCPNPHHGDHDCRYE